jgi:xanthine dehydrogenase YagR molybdenum-binding subunit
MYACANFEAAQHDVFINAGPGCAMRAPGNTPGAWAVEQAVDELAERLSVDPLVLRDTIDLSPVRREERRIGAERIGWLQRHAPGVDPGPIKRGMGVAQSLWGANVQINCACEVRIMRDGSVEILSGVQDIGTGIGTVMAQVVAEVLGLHVDQITVRIGDTEFPAGPPSYGSRTTASITPAARIAASRVLQSLFHEAALALNAAPEQLLSSSSRAAGASSFGMTQAVAWHLLPRRRGCARTGSARSLPAAMITPGSAGEWKMPRSLNRISAACSLPPSPSTPKRALSGLSAWWPSRIAAGR